VSHSYWQRGPTIADAQSTFLKVIGSDSGECQGSCRMKRHAALCCGGDSKVRSGLSLTSVIGYAVHSHCRGRRQRGGRTVHRIVEAPGALQFLTALWARSVGIDSSPAIDIGCREHSTRTQRDVDLRLQKCAEKTIFHHPTRTTSLLRDFDRYSDVLDAIAL
jgi:hypothetical protein